MKTLSSSHDLQLLKIKEKERRRRWTEICRKVDGPYKKKRSKESDEAILPYPYISTCITIFI